MFVLIRRLTLGAGLTLLLAACGNSALADPVSQSLIDARQERQIWTTYALSPYLRANNLTVLVQNGRVRLTGTVAEEAQRDLATEIALAVGGIHEVNDQIIVRSGYVPTPKDGERSYGEVIDDAGVTSEVKSKIAWSKSSGALRALVDTQRGTVRLRGLADSQTAKDFAGHLAGTTRGVTAVDNQLTVTNGPLSTLEGSGTRPPGQTDDNWITAKVKSTLLYSNASVSNIAVSTTGGDVTLTGKAKNSAERALGIELAQDVRGVRSVNSQGYTF